MRKLPALTLMLFAVLVFACAPAADEPAADEMAAEGESAEPAAVTGTADEAEAGDDGLDMDGADSAAVEDTRAAWSRPFEVYEFVGIEEGDVVVDLLAGGGYNTLKVAEVVGPEGKVIAERARPELQREVESGELETAAPVTFIGWIDELEPNSVDAVLAIRAYHLFEDVPAQLATLYEALRPGGVVGVVEIRLDQETGHDMTTHRVGDQTVISDFESAGFELVDTSDILRVEGDDYTEFAPEGKQRYQLDRMLLKFRKPAA